MQCIIWSCFSQCIVDIKPADPMEVIVKCQNCQHENPPGVNFCANCGATLQQICPSCRTPNQPNTNFCQNCGAAFRQTPPQPSPSVPPQAAAAQPPVIIIQQPATHQTTSQQPVVVMQGEEPDPSLLGALFILAFRVVGGIAIGYVIGQGWIWASSAISNLLSASLF